MKKLTLTLTLLAVAFFATSAMADNIFLTITDGTFTVTASGTNSLGFSGSVGSFTIDFTSGFANLPGAQNGGQVSITNNTVTNTGSATGTLTFTITGIGFNLPVADASLSPNMRLASAGSYSQTLNGGISLGSGVSFQGFADPSNSGFQLNGTPTCTDSGPGTAGACAATYSDFTRGSGPYSLTEVTKITLTAHDQISTTSNVSATAVPEPASLALFGSGLLAGGGFIRRKLIRG
jgi:hypothetical protein